MCNHILTYVVRNYAQGKGGIFDYRDETERPHVHREFGVDLSREEEHHLQLGGKAPQRNRTQKA